MRVTRLSFNGTKQQYFCNNPRETALVERHDADYEKSSAGYSIWRRMINSSLTLTDYTNAIAWVGCPYPVNKPLQFESLGVKLNENNDVTIQWTGP